MFTATWGPSESPPGGPSKCTTITTHLTPIFQETWTRWYQNVSILDFTGAKHDGDAKLQSNRHHQQTNIQLFTVQMRFCHPTNSVKALKGKVSHSVDLVTPGSPGGLPSVFVTIITPSSSTKTGT